MNGTTATKGFGSAQSSRERIIRLLLKQGLTVDELASSLELTKNAVRAQLALLVREGAVRVQGARKSTRRPAAVYGLAASIDQPSSGAYSAVLSGMVATLADWLEPKQVEQVLKGTGRRIADSLPPLAGSLRERVEGAAQVLGTLGSVSEVFETDGTFVIKGHGCPISKAVQADVRTCLAMEAFLARLTGLKVRERCDHGMKPSCRFEFALPVSRPPGSGK
jgi:predicted ArsR family transcriptional regulator